MESANTMKTRKLSRQKSCICIWSTCAHSNWAMFSLPTSLGTNNERCNLAGQPNWGSCLKWHLSILLENFGKQKIHHDLRLLGNQSSEASCKPTLVASLMRTNLSSQDTPQSLPSVPAGMNSQRFLNNIHHHHFGLVCGK